MAVVLGVNAAAGVLYFVLADDRRLENPTPVTFEVSAGLPRPRALEAGRDEIAAMLARHSIDVVVLAEPESTSTSYKSLLPRMTAEVVLEFGAGMAGVELRRLSRAKLRSTHGFGRAGSVSSHANTVINEPLSPYWSNKRDIAALAALACS